MYYYDLLVISGPSGSGKGSLIRVLSAILGSRVYYARSVTTRSPRNDNNDHYLFVSEEDFSNMLSADAFAEYARYDDHWYGTPWSEIKPDHITILDINVIGLRQLKGNPKLSPNCSVSSVFVLPPSATELFTRLKMRGTESDCKILSRLSIALEELGSATEYDYILCHDSTEEASRTLIRILDGQDVTCASVDLKKFKTDLEHIVSSLKIDRGTRIGN